MSTKPLFEKLDTKEGDVEDWLVNVINGHFTESDTWVTLAYEMTDKQPTIEQARKDLASLVKQLIASRGGREVQFVATVHQNERASYLNVIVSSPDKETIEKIWPNGRAHAKRMSRDEDTSFNGLARYIAKLEPKEVLLSCYWKIESVVDNVKEEKVMTEQAEMEMLKMLVQLSGKYGLTIKNIREITSRACEYMEKNATL